MIIAHELIIGLFACVAFGVVALGSDAQAGQATLRARVAASAEDIHPFIVGANISGDILTKLEGRFIAL